MQIIKFKSVEIGLSECMSFRPEKALDTLGRIIAFSDLARAFRDLNRRMPVTTVEISIHRRRDVEKVDAEIVGLLQKLFPVEEDFMLESSAMGESIFDSMEYCRIIPAFCGFATSWDEIDEALEDATSYNQVMSVPLFIGAYMNSFDAQAWEKFNSHFEWGVTYEQRQGDWMLDLSKLYRIIKRSRKIKFDVSYIQAVFQDTGLAFFDFNPYDEAGGYEAHVPWSYDSIVGLAKQWKKAEKIVQRIEHNTQIGKDSEQLRLLLGAIKECESTERSRP